MKPRHVRGGMRWPLTWLLLLTSLDASPAPEPEPFGSSLYALSGQGDTDTTPATLPALAQLDTQMSRVSALERELGPYAPALNEVRLKAAADAEQVGAYRRALDLYRSALHGIRVNEGLDARAQMAVLESIERVLRRLGDAAALSTQMDYLYRLSGNGQLPWSEFRLAVFLRWLDTQIDVLAGTDWVSSGTGARVNDVYEEAERVREQICEQEAWRRNWCGVVTLRGLALLYLIEARVMPLVTGDFSGADLRDRSILRVGRDPIWDPPPWEQRLHILKRTARGEGRGILDRALEASPDDPMLVLARGDWEWFHNRRDRALERYRGLQTTHPEWFERPVPIPQPPLLARDPNLIPEGDRVRLSASVSEQGRAEQITVVAPEGEEVSERNLSRARRAARSLRFRPVLTAEGEPVAQEVELTLGFVSEP